MARQIRHNVEGGWYHITTRGMRRRDIFSCDRDREHFIGLLQGLVERYGIVLHAYVLMDNHFHLLIETPHANASRALQWLNLSYAAWFNEAGLGTYRDIGTNRLSLGCGLEGGVRLGHPWAVQGICL